MKATSSGFVIGLVLALLVPMSVVGQDPLEGTSAVSDATGDLTDIYTEEPLDGPGYLDIEEMTVDVADGELQVTFDTAGSVPAQLDFMETTVGYYLQVDTDGDGSDDYWVDTNSVGGWKTNVFDLSTAYNTEVGTPALVKDLVIAKVSLSDLGDPRDIRFRGLVQSSYTPDANDPLNSTDWEDRVPDDEDAWLTLGEEDISGDVSLSPAPSPPRQNAEELLQTIMGQPGEQVRKVGYPAVRKRILALWQDYPEEMAGFRYQYSGDTERVTTKQLRQYALSQIKTGEERGVKPLEKRAVPPARARAVGELLTVLVDIATFSDDPDLSRDAAKAADALWDYGVSTIYPGKAAKSQKAIREYVELLAPYWTPNY